ncbi:MAG TPA: aminotransferase class I/II-fold pyridoxal phosphate-dependent enzyme [Pyrinomonadaceae bacterium]
MTMRISENVGKVKVDELALFGGGPLFAEPLHVGRPNIGNRQEFESRVSDILDRRWLTNGGQYVKQLQQRIADFVGVKYCIAMCNATVALEIAIRALGLTGEVIVPSFTFIATAHALQWQEITPVFCDIDPLTHTLDADKVEQMITPRTTGIIAVHLWGNHCNIDALTEIANRRNLKLLFDSAHAFGCSYRGRMIGGFGDAEVFSFHATKFLNSLEGGAVVTNNRELAEKIGLMKNFGFTYYDRTDFIGTNGKMNEISAAMGLTNLDSVDDFIAINRSNYLQYAEELAGLDGVTLLTYDEKEKSNYQYIVLEIDQSKTILSRDQLMEILHKENVLARRYFYPGCHRMEPYRSYFPHAGLLLAETERMANRVLCLPTGTGVSESDIGLICQLIRLVVEKGSEVAARFDSQNRA